MKRATKQCQLSGSSEESDDDSSSDDQFNRVQKKEKLDNENNTPIETNYSNKTHKMMAKMGYVANTGLGKLGQGRLEPVEASSQKGRRGLGLRLDGLDNAALQWDPQLEKIDIKETVEWIRNEDDDLYNLTRDILDEWTVEGSKKLTIDDESNFCEPDILSNVLRSKTVFDHLGGNDMIRARKRSNPFETIRGVFFLNRAAMKMANMDAMLDFMFTSPKDKNGSSLIHENDLLYFADVCAGPGGFSEYVLWRKNWEAKGFGFTLRKENDFNLQDFYAGHPETFDTYYGVKEDGDIFDSENISSLTNYVLKQTHEAGVHFMMADGGFSVEGQENVQEILSKQLYLCQCLVALSIVREKGHCIIKMFDLFTPFSIGLIYLMYKCFKQISIVKPNTSRPANSERYLVCKWKKAGTDTMQRHIFEINNKLTDLANSNSDINELVPLDIMKNDTKFFNYIYNSNNNIGQNQIIGLLKIAAFAKDSTLNETRQSELRTKSLILWKIEDKMRQAPNTKKKCIYQYIDELLKTWSPEPNVLTINEECLNKKKPLKSFFRNIDTWYFVPIDTIENQSKFIRTFFVSKGGRDIYAYKSKSWVPLRSISNINVEMSPDTLIYGEIVKELLGEGRSQTLTLSLHIIDGIILGNIDIRSYPLRKRIMMCQKFARALSKPCETASHRESSGTETTAPIRCKQLYPMSKLNDFFNGLNHYRLKDDKLRLGLKLRDTIDKERFYVPRGLLFFNELKSSLVQYYSKTNKQIYYHDTIQDITFYVAHLPNKDDIYGSFRNTFMHRFLWKWDDVNQVLEKYDGDIIESILYRTELEEFINNVNLS